MKITKTLLITVFALTISFTISGQRGPRIGYIDMEYILESVPEYKEANTQLEGKVQRWRQDIEKMQNDVDQMKLDLANERVLLTKELIDEREEEIKIKEDEMLQYQQNRFGPNGDLMIQKRQLVQPIQDQVFNIVQEIAESRNYDFIFDRSADVVMLFAAKRNDISDVVLRSLERAGRRVQAQNRKEQREIEQQERQAMREQSQEATQRQKEAEQRKEEREKEMEQRKAEREAQMDQRQKDRETMLKERQQERDSIQNQRQKEREEQRQRMMEEREKRRDSILNARKNRRG